MTAPPIVASSGRRWWGEENVKFSTLANPQKLRETKNKRSNGLMFHLRLCGPTETRRGKTNTRGIYGVQALNGRGRVTAGGPEPKQGPHRWVHALTAAL